MLKTTLPTNLMRVHLLAAACFLLPFSALAATPVSQPTEVYITVTPKDALIIFDGVAQNLSPVTISDLSAGEHLVVIQKQGYRELRKTIRLGRGQRIPLEFEMQRLNGLVLVHSVPPGTDILINGAFRGKTPLLLSDLPFGNYRLKAQRTGFRPKEVDLAISDRVPRRIDIDLTSDSASLIINCTPDGANVKVDGLDKGAAPCSLPRVPEGNVTVEVTMDGYKPYKDTLKLAAGENQTVNVVLKPIPSTLKIVSIPTKARVYVNNQYKGDSPVTLRDTPPGSYRIRVEKPDHETQARTVQLERATELTEEFRLAGNVGSLSVVTIPAGVTVSIDGTPSGTTPVSANPKEKKSDPLVIDNITMGKKEIKLTKKGYFEVTVPVEIEKGKEATLKKVLNRQFVPDYEVRTSSGAIRGVLVWVQSGNVKLETAPGIFRIIPASQIRTRRPVSTPK